MEFVNEIIKMTVTRKANKNIDNIVTPHYSISIDSQFIWEINDLVEQLEEITSKHNTVYLTINKRKYHLKTKEEMKAFILGVEFVNVGICSM